MKDSVLSLACGLWVALTSPLAAQGFAGLGTEADGFTVPDAAYTLTFPQDHAAHPDYRIEWWYLTANLQAQDGQDYGVQWTLFRTALAPETTAGAVTGWGSPQIWLGHAGLTTPTTHFSTERRARGGIGQAGVSLDPFTAWIDDWQMISTALAGEDPLNALSLSASAPAFAYDLQLQAKGPLVLQGTNGYSVKSAEGQASHYYSQPFYSITGTLTLPEGPVDVTGQGWLDREWSSQPLSEGQSGWDWISLHFDSGAKLMGFRLRDSTAQSFTSATWIAPDGTPTPYADGALTMTPIAFNAVAGRQVPTEWQITLPDRDVDVTLDALTNSAWMETSFPYWEGPVVITGSHPGRGYLEMTGYDP